MGHNCFTLFMEIGLCKLMEQCIHRNKILYLRNELLELCNSLAEIRPDTDWSSNRLTLQIHHMDLHHHLCNKHTNIVSS